MQLEDIQNKAAFEAFVTWSGTPEALRMPKTQTEMALLLGVEQSTISRWKNYDGFQQLVDKETKKWIGGKVPDMMYGAFLQFIKKGDPALLKMLVTASGSEEFAAVAKVGSADAGGAPQLPNQTNIMNIFGEPPKRMKEVMQEPTQEASS